MVACDLSSVMLGHNLLHSTCLITVFGLSKITTLVQTHPLSSDLKSRLQSVEEQLSESMASLYNSLIIAKQDLEPEINSHGLLDRPMTFLQNIQHVESLPATTPSKKRSKQALNMLNILKRCHWSIQKAMAIYFWSRSGLATISELYNEPFTYAMLYKSCSTDCKCLLKSGEP